MSAAANARSWRLRAGSGTAFSANDRDVLQSFADQAAIAVRNARLYAQAVEEFPGHAAGADLSYRVGAGDLVFGLHLGEDALDVCFGSFADLSAANSNVG